MKRRKIRKLSFLISTISYIITILLFLFCKKFEIISGPLISIANFFLVIGIGSVLVLNCTFSLDQSEPLSEEEMEELLKLIESK